MAIYHLLDSKKYVDETTRQARRKICDGCDKRNPVLDKCRACGCFVALKIKLKTEACPLGNWQKILA